MHRDIEQVFYDQETIAKRVGELGQMIAADYEGRDPVLIGVLKGSFVFMADLVRATDIKCQIEFLGVSSYGSETVSSGVVRITRDLDCDIAGRDVIVVEDILDSGLTLSYLIGYLQGRKPASIAICTLLDKPERRRAEVDAKYIGFTIPDAFVVGYGLDYIERYRNLPYIGVLKPSVYQV
ncbi:MAG: hypoxanthine phosphoribosyltransferase [Oscillospiraceae bacterium]|nr:hypoxanthine phosphoribosyltransferase [Oscillospiraceae bacterium]